MQVESYSSKLVQCTLTVVKSEFQFTCSEAERKKAIDSIELDKFLSPDFLQYYVVWYECGLFQFSLTRFTNSLSSDSHKLEEVATIGGEFVE
jgi:hypothetical protein